jgi:uncharacterized membrane protein SpoIIM required for sporulation
MIPARWYEKRKPYWERLEQLVGRSQRGGLAALSYRELQELGLLYRQAAADLASVREDPVGRRLADYLNQLLGRAHNLIYLGRPARPGGILAFYRQTFPALFRATAEYTLGAFAIFALGALAGFLVSLGDPAFQRFFLGGAMADTIERREMWTHSILTIKPLATSAILTNNISVSLVTFAMGITAGVGTLYILATNGLMLGVITAACWQAGMSLKLWGFVAPHGILELPAIFIAGGAGLLVARGLVFPGLLPRRDSLTVYGGQGVRLVLGLLPLLVIAGVVEGFFSPLPLPVAVKFIMAAGLGGLMVLYLARGGRERNGHRPGHLSS